MNRTNPLDTVALQAELAMYGLNLFQTFASASLADSMPELGLPASINHLLLVGSAGRDLWSALPQDYFNKENPVDEYSIDCIENCLGNHLAADEWSILFPEITADSKVVVPLQKLGALAGWHHPSPLGIGINGTHGLWFAYRAVVAIEADLVAMPPVAIESGSPCVSCKTTPCLSHCPADALTLGAQPDLNACVNHRLAEDSSCASTCLARFACPVGDAFKYSELQTAYFL